LLIQDNDTQLSYVLEKKKTQEKKLQTLADQCIALFIDALDCFTIHYEIYP
jgi:hypothetical protein